jgi:hypothetical protein
MLIEDLNPKLFNSLGAGVKVLQHAKNEEDYAQVALSARRYIEQLADVLFPARNEIYEGRKVGNAEYKNRIWAFISDSVPNNDSQKNEKVNLIGKELDRLINQTNAILHSAKEKEAVMNCFIDLAKLSILLLTLPSNGVRNSYYAFNENISDFFEKSFQLK